MGVVTRTAATEANVGKIPETSRTVEPQVETTHPAKKRRVEGEEAKMAMEVFQPAWQSTGTNGIHDHYQCHFFHENLCINVRAFGSDSGNSIWCWICFPKNKHHATGLAEVIELVGAKVGHGKADPDSKRLQLEKTAGEESYRILETEGGRAGETILLKNAEYELSLRMLPGFLAKMWSVSGQTEHNKVIHRPDLRASVQLKRQGEEIFSDAKMCGYSKRYFGPYPRYWGYHFMIANQSDMAVGTADARFGDDKYNYFKSYFKATEAKDAYEPLEVFEAERETCYHQGDVARGSGEKLEIVKVIAERKKVITGLESSDKSMESEMTEKIVQYIYTPAPGTIGTKYLKGDNGIPLIGFYEKCFGTLG